MIQILKSDRLVLRPFHLEDAQTVFELASEYEIAANTLRIPHPYELSMAEEWITGQATAEAEGKELVRAITQADSDRLIGSIGLILIQAFNQAELGYWIGKPYWNKGYASEAAMTVLKFGFEKLNFHRIHAHHLSRNQASGMVLQKIGMQHEGHLRQHILKWGKYEDIDLYGILKDEFLGKNHPGV